MQTFGKTILNACMEISIIVSFTQLPSYTVCLCHIIIVFPFFHTTTHNHSSLFICHLNLLCHWHGMQIFFVNNSRRIFCLLLCPILLVFSTTACTASTLVALAGVEKTFGVSVIVFSLCTFLLTTSYGCSQNQNIHLHLHLHPAG